jgi:hypothetical protein
MIGSTPNPLICVVTGVDRRRLKTTAVHGTMD